MQISKRDFLKKLGLLGAAGATGAAFGDEYVPMKGKLPPGAIGDPMHLAWARNIFPLEHTMTDGPSCRLVDGKVLEPAHEIPIFHETDVVVVGGGPAGFSAAISAARAGAKVALVERYGSLGGLFTNGMVLVVLGTCARDESKRFHLVTTGLVTEFCDRAYALGSHVSTFPRDRHNWNVHWQPTVDPEGAKYLMDRMVEEAKVEMFFHSWGVDTIQDGNKVLGIVFNSKQGRQAILAKQVVDCTGDADVLFQAGGDYQQITHCIGHCVRLGNMDRITAKKVPVDAEGVRRPGRWPVKSNEGNPSTWWGNTDSGPKGNGLDIRDLTAAEIGFRKTWWEHVATMRKEPGWEQVFLANTCSQIGPRASRLIDAEFRVERKMLTKDWKVDDSIGWFGVVGLHPAFQAPYRQLVPKKIDNVLCAGRCLGAGDTIDTFRIIAPCFVTGQAAGIAAALSAKAGLAPRNLPYGDLKRELERQNVMI